MPDFSVLHINDHNAIKGGVESYLADLLPALEQKQVECTLVYGAGEADIWQNATKIPEISKASFNHDSTCYQKLNRLIGEIKPDIIHIHGIQNNGVWKSVFEQAGRCKLILTGHDYRWICPANTFFRKKSKSICLKKHGELKCHWDTFFDRCVTPRPLYAAYYEKRVRLILQNYNMLNSMIFPSKGAAKRFNDAFGSNISGVVLPYFCPVDPLTSPRPIPNNKTITFLGRIGPAKGHDLFIEMLGKLPAEWKGIMAGGITDDNIKQLTVFADKWKCRERITFKPWISRTDVPDLFDQTTIFVFPSLWEETLGIVGIESLSRGVPVLGSDLGGVSEWLHDDETGYRIKAGDTDAFRDGALKIADSENNLLEMGQAGINLVNEKFSKSSHVNQLIQVYKSS